MKPVELIVEIKKELERVYGGEIAGLWQIYQHGSWYYFSMPVKNHQRVWVMDPFTKPVHKAFLLKILEKLKEMDSFRS